MRSMFVTEYLKYQKPVYIAAFVHLLLLVFLVSMGFSPLARPAGNLWLLAAAIAAGLFGIQQMRSHVRSNNWIYLLQRPLSRQRICAALLMAAICLLLIALVLPYMLLILYLDARGGQVVELRHYLLLPLACSAVFSAYLIACFAALSPQRLGFLAFVAVFVFVPNFVGTRLVLFAWLALLLFAYLAFASFRNDLTTPTGAPLKLLLSELPIQFGLLWIMAVLLMLLFETKWSINGDNPIRNPAPDTDYYAFFWESPEDLMRSALEGSSHPDADFVRQQLGVGEFVRLYSPGLRNYPQRHQRPMLDSNLVLSDPERKTTWYFSHSSMLFEGFDTNSLERVGWLGPDGFAAADTLPEIRFDSVPWVTANSYVLNAQHLYQVNWDTLQWRLRFTLDKDADESLNDSLIITGNVTSVLSSKNLYLFRSAEVRDIDSKLTARTRLPLPAPDKTGMMGKMIVVMELLSGYLVSMVSDVPNAGMSQDFDLFGHAQQHIYRTTDAFDNELLNHRLLPSTYSAAYIYKDFVVSPGMRLVSDALTGWYQKKSVALTYPLVFHPFPLPVLLLALLLNVLSVVLGWRLLRNMNLANATKLTWLALLAINGLVGLASLYFGHYWRRYTRLAHAKICRAELAAVVRPA